MDKRFNRIFLVLALVVMGGLSTPASIMGAGFAVPFPKSVPTHRYDKVEEYVMSDSRIFELQRSVEPKAKAINAERSYFHRFHPIEKITAYNRRSLPVAARTSLRTPPVDLKTALNEGTAASITTTAKTAYTPLSVIQ